MLIEGGQRDDLATAGIPLIAQVEVVDIAVLQVEIALHIRRQVEIVIHRGRHLTKLGAVDAAAIAEARLVLVGESPGHIGRREQVAMAIVMALVAGLRRAGVRDELHLVILIAQAGMHLKRSEGQRGHGIGRTKEIVATIIVELVHILKQVELVGSGIGGIAEQRGHVHAAEPFGQMVAHGVVPIKRLRVSYERLRYSP